MRTIIKLVSVLCGISLLCACSDSTSEAANDSALRAGLESSVLGVEYDAHAKDTAYSVPTESEVTLKLIGEPLNARELVDFTYNRKWAKDVVDTECVGDFLDSLNNSQYKELYCNALSLVHLVSTENLEISSAVDRNDPAFLEVFDKSDGSTQTFVESGYTYSSFYEAFCSVFTQETADIILSRYPYFKEYNQEMWFVSTSAGGNIGEVLQEYELISETDTTLEFRRISYSVDIGEPIEYDPAKKDEYNKTYINFKFVLTENGWRVQDFLNATDPDRGMLFA